MEAFVPTAIARLHALSLVLLLVATGPASAQLSPADSAKTLRPAEGFEVSLWAAEPLVRNPSAMDIDSRARVWIAEGLNYRLFENQNRGTNFQRLPGADRIKILEDSNGDGTADKEIVFADDIYPMPLGLAIEEIWQNGVYRGARAYVGFSAELLVLEDTNGDDKADRRYALLRGFRGMDTEHGLHGMALGPDGKLYFTQGDARYGTDKVQEGETTFDVVDGSGRRVRSAQMGTTLRVNLDGTGFEVLSWRHRNNYEACVNSFGHVFVSDNDDDGDLGCRMAWIMPPGNYGYRTQGSTRQWAEEQPGIVPKLAGTGNGGPTGILVYEGDLFPPQYHGAVLQLDAGTHQVNFHPLQRHGAAFRSEYHVLLRGEDSWFRPTDAAVAPDGSLFLCDWYDAGVGASRLSDQTTGRVYRLAPRGSRPRTPPADFTSVEGCVAALRSPNVVTRFAARQELIARGAAAREPLQNLLATGRPHERARALFVLANLRQTGVEDLQKALKDRDSPIRELALRLLAGDVRRIAVVEPESARTIAPRAMAALPDVVPLAGDPDAGVRRELLLALRDVPTSQAGSALRTLVNGWDGRDRYYLEALHLALRDRDGAFLANLFAELARSALADGWNDEPVALPPYFPVTTNDAYLHIGDELPPANAASKAIGLAWVLRRPEALPALRALLERNQSAHVAQAAELAIVQLDDPRAAELLLERFLAHDADPDRQRQILRRLGMKLGGGWKRARDTALADKVFLRALGSVELRVEAIQAIARCGAGRYAERLMELVHAEREEPATRSAALEALGELRYEPARRLAAQLVEEGKSKAQGGPLPMAAVAALARFRGAEAHGVLENMARDQQYPLDLRRRATQVLAATTTGARRLLSLREQSQFPEDLVTELTFLLHHHPDPNVRRVARATIELPKTASGTRIEDLDKVLSLRGDAARGRAVFFRDQSACARCHRVCGVGESGGPDLSSIGTKYAKSELLYHLLNPSGAINYNYVTYAFSMTDGRLLNGLITDESADVIELKTPQGERVSLPKSEIEAKRPQNTSLMPDGLVETMTEQDVADLIDYLASLRQSTSPVGEYYLLGPVPARTFPEAVAIDVHTAWVAPSGRRYAWRRVATNRDQTLDLSALLGNDEGLEVLSLVPVVSDRPQTARVVLNTSIPVSLTHNGRAIPLDRPRDSQSSFCEVPLSLQAGVNDLVIRAAAGTGRAALRTTIVSDHAVRFAFDRAR